MTLWPLILYFAGIMVIVAFMMGLSYLLGERHHERRTGEPYESGIPVTGSARARHPIQFYLVAMFFVLFDLEAVFLFAWGVAAKKLGWTGFIEAAIFVGVLMCALFYLARIGSFEWGRQGK